MEWYTKLNKAMEYIEQHLTDEIDYEYIAMIAGCPAYYFLKMFSYLTGISLQEYIKRRRMSYAAVELIHSDIKVLDLALKYGYQSPTAFNRAFQSVHGLAPSMVRKQNSKVQAYPPFHFSMDIQGTTPLSYHMQHKDSFSLTGILFPLSRNLEENFKNVPNYWNRSVQDGTLHQLWQLHPSSPKALLGVSIHHKDDWNYMIAVSIKENLTYDHMTQLIIPKADWAVFQGRGTNQSLQELERSVITQWLPTSGFRYADIPDIEVYLKADPSDMIYEYWLPVIQTKEKKDDKC